MSLRLIPVIFFLFLGLQTRSQSLESIDKLLNEISFHQRTDSAYKNLGIVRNIQITEFSFEVDGQDFTFKNPYIGLDSTTLFLLKIKKGEIVPYGDQGGCLVCIKEDSILAFRMASQSFPIKSSDSVYQNIKNKIHDVISWNKEFASRVSHPGYDGRNGNFEGLSFWTEENILIKELEIELKKRRVGEVFLFKWPEHELGWIVYKTDQEKYFIKKYLVYLEPKK